MSTTIEFFSGSPRELVESLEAWFNADNGEDEQMLSDRLYALHPHTDFSFHVRWPEDFDAFCQALNAEGFDVPSSVQALLEEEIWSDGVSAHVDRVSQPFVQAIARLSDDHVRQIVERWLSYFSEADTSYTQFYENSLQALSALREVALHAIEYRQSLLLLRVW